VPNGVRDAQSIGVEGWVNTAISLSFPAILALIMALPSQENATKDAISYLRVSSEEQADSGLGLEAQRRVDLQEAVSLADSPHDDLLALDEALTRLAAREPAKAELVKLRYFAGLSIDEAADLMRISRTTAKRYWAFARAWLLAEIDDAEAEKKS